MMSPQPTLCPGPQTAVATPDTGDPACSLFLENNPCLRSPQGGRTPSPHTYSSQMPHSAPCPGSCQIKYYPPGPADSSLLDQQVLLSSTSRCLPPRPSQQVLTSTTTQHMHTSLLDQHVRTSPLNQQMLPFLNHSSQQTSIYSKVLSVVSILLDRFITEHQRSE